MINKKEITWGRHSKSWLNFGVPQKPSSRDVDFFNCVITAQLKPGPDPFNVLILGVTPELVGLHWPSSTKMIAIDKSQSMIADVWEPPSHLEAFAVNGDWFDLPFENAKFDLIIGDGCTTQFDSMKRYQVFFEHISTKLRPNGSLLMRYFTRQDSIFFDVISLLNKKEIKNFGSLKWMIAHNLTNKLTHEVCVGLIFSEFSKLFDDRELLSEKTGWSMDEINTIDSYEDNPQVYTFPTIEVLNTQKLGILENKSINFSGSDFSEYCPVMLDIGINGN